MDLCCTRVSLHGACPFTRIHMAVSGRSSKHTWSNVLAIRNQTQRGAYQNDEFTTRPAALKMKTPETRNRIYWGSHMQHIYRESTIGAPGTFIAGGLTEQ